MCTYSKYVNKQLIQNNFIHNVNPCWAYKFQHCHEIDVLTTYMHAVPFYVHYTYCGYWNYFQNWKNHILLSILLSICPSSSTQKPSKLFWSYQIGLFCISFISSAKPEMHFTIIIQNKQTQPQAFESQMKILGECLYLIKKDVLNKLLVEKLKWNKTEKPKSNLMELNFQ